MRTIFRQILVAVLMTVCYCTTQAQQIHFKAYKSSGGIVAKNLPDVYAWGPWNLSSAQIMFDLKKNSIKVDGTAYEILEKPKSWTVKRDHKYVQFACITPSYNKVNVKLYQYDRGEFRIYVNEEKNAMRYVVQYLDKHDPLGKK